MDASQFTPSSRHIAIITGMTALLFFIAPLAPQLVHYDVAFAFRSFLYLCAITLLVQFGGFNAWSHLKKDSFFLPALLGVTASAISLIYAPNFFRAGNALSHIIALLLLWMTLRLMPFGVVHRRWLSVALIVGGVLAAIQALYVQWAGHGELIEALQSNAMYDETMRTEMIASLEANRALGNFGNPNHSAGYFVLCLWPIWLMFRQYKNTTVRALLILSSLILMIGVYRTFSRSALLALAFSLVLIALFEWLQRGGRISWKALATAALSPVVVIAGALMLVPAEWFGNRLMTISTIVARTHFYRGAIAVICEHPWFGVGLDGFEAFYAAHIRPGDLEARYVHNAFLESTVEGGLIGALLFLWLLVCVFAWLWKRWSHNHNERPVIWAAFGACSVFLFLSCVDFHNRLPELWYVPLFLMSGVSVQQSPPISTKGWAPALTWVLGILLVVCWGYMGLCKYVNRMASDEGYYHLVDQKFARAQRSYERAVFWDPSDSSSWNNLGRVWARIPTPTAQQKRLECMKTAVAWAPRRATLRADLAETLFALGYSEEALQELRAAQALFPARPRYYDLAAQFYQALNRTEDAARMEETARRIKQEIEERKL
jgi:O-antigen ligase